MCSTASDNLPQRSGPISRGWSPSFDKAIVMLWAILPAARNLRTANCTDPSRRNSRIDRAKSENSASEWVVEHHGAALEQSKPQPKLMLTRINKPVPLLGGCSLQKWSDSPLKVDTPISQNQPGVPLRSGVNIILVVRLRAPNVKKLRPPLSSVV